MDPFFYARDTLSRALSRKKTLVFLAVFFLVSAVLGMCFVKNYAMYEYHLNACNRYLDRVCYADRSVALIFLERLAGHLILLLLLLLGGIHIALVPVSFGVLFFRAYTFGGSLVVFFSAYGLSVLPVVLVLYLPIHLLLDAVFLAALSLSMGRCRCFAPCREEIFCLLFDLFTLLLAVAAALFAEALLLLALFHPIGNIL